MEALQSINRVTEAVIGAAVTVHREIGPGLLESAYEMCMTAELVERGLYVERQKELPLSYKGVTTGHAYRMDFLVERKVVVEIKAVSCLMSVHEAQLLTYLRLSGCRVGLLINFNVEVLMDGLRRMVHGY